MQSGDLIHERYRLEETIGSGGMAEVWLATDERLKRHVAIKFPALNLAEDPEFLVRFFSEAQAVARLSHENVVKVLDFGEFEGRSYLVMEHVAGGSLENVDKPLDAQRARELVRQAALAVGAAHEQGIVHRDIKPANILIDEQGHVKLADFGIAATAVSERLTATGAAIGSPHYISPEQASGGTATPASDVYALGVVLYELVTAVRPIDADNLAAIAIAHVEREPRPPSAVGDVDPELEAVIMRCLAKEPDERYSDGNELAGALESPGSATGPLLETAPVAAVAADPAPDEVEEDVAGRSARVGWILAGAALLVALVVLAVALTTGESPEPAQARAPARSPSPSPSHRHRRHSPSPSLATPGTGAVGAPSSSPSPKQSASPEDSSSGQSGSGGGGGQPRPKPKPKPRPSSSPRASAPPSPVASPS